ncbi:MAG: UDP-N-acetylglucosamine diphosphorylase, partial [Pygmaiobacter sp.]
ILPGTILKGTTTIGEGSVIGPCSLLEDAHVGAHVTFNASQGHSCSIADGAEIGPYVQLRPNSVIGKKVHIGDFVEVKNSTIGEGTAIAHLTYIGDADVGKYCNFGCGVVIVNYDGEVKSRTTIGDYCFVGCNTNLVAPVRMGNGSYTAAGSTITEDLPPQALGIARARQITKEGWAEGKLSAYITKKSHLETEDTH